MRIRYSLLLVVVLAAGLLVANGEKPAGNTAAIKFTGSSTLHDFHGTVESQPISFARTGNRWSAEGRANVTDMSTANAKRDKSMFAMFSATAFPSIHGSVSNAPVPVTGATNVTMQLRIRDKEQSVTVSITGWRETNGVVQFHGATKVSLKDFGLTPPSVLGIIRVGDTVTLEADVTAGGTP